jgi:hypothetical protein
MAQSLPAMKTNPKFIFFTDFDGTITLFDSECHLPLTSYLCTCYTISEVIPPANFVLIRGRALGASCRLFQHVLYDHIDYIRIIFQKYSRAYFLCLLNDANNTAGNDFMVTRLADSKDLFDL